MDKEMNKNNDGCECCSTQQQKDQQEATCCVENTSEDVQGDATAHGLEEVKKQLDEKTKQCQEYWDKLQRVAAEFDNYKKRTAREKESIFTDSVSDVAGSFLPVVDNLERAIDASNGEGDSESFKEGVVLVLKQMKEVLKNLGIEEIEAVGQPFDPQLHNAVMHIDDENHGENEVVEVFQKGYILKDKVIRHSMVKVAN